MSGAPERVFETGGHAYRAGRLSTFQQFSVASQWREALVGLSMLKRERPPELDDAGFQEAVRLIFTGGTATMPDARREGVTNLLLSVVSRQQKGHGGGWAKMLTPDGRLMFDDLDLPSLIHVLYEVLDHNRILDFFSAGPSPSSGPRDGE